MVTMYYFIHANDQPDPTTVIYHVKVGSSVKEREILQRVRAIIAQTPTQYYFEQFSIVSDNFIYKLKSLIGLSRIAQMSSTDLLFYLSYALPST